MSTLSMMVYRKDDGPVLNPLKYFKPEDLEKLAPYAIFTGEGFMATVAIPHECDCEYCDHEDEEEKRFFRTKEELDKEIKRINEDISGEEELISVEPYFYARVVKQNYSDILGGK